MLRLFLGLQLNYQGLTPTHVWWFLKIIGTPKSSKYYSQSHGFGKSPISQETPIVAMWPEGFPFVSSRLRLHHRLCIETHRSLKRAFNSWGVFGGKDMRGLYY